MRRDRDRDRSIINRPRDRQQWCTSRRHFAVLTINTMVGLFQDHLFLVREGWPIWFSGKFKVVTFGPVFELGSMTGLMDENRQHSGIMTNFRIFRAESRLYWSWSGYGRPVRHSRPLLGPPHTSPPRAPSCGHHDQPSQGLPREARSAGWT